jgi:L-alanine-DL-glutamate epimerase-like enolase superfamily enzyme
MRITRVTQTTLHIPFYTERVTRAMQRAQTHDERVCLIRIEADNDLVGFCDQHGRQVIDQEALIGQNPYALINRDDLGFGVQMALLDLVGKDAGVPVHALIGRRVRDSCPISWWDIDMPAEDWAAEAAESVQRGHTCFKMKARPWRDIHAQVEEVGKVVPPDYKFDIDFNAFLLTAAGAEPTLRKLDEHPNTGMYESPFSLAKDLAGARMLRQQVQNFVVEHYNPEVVHADAADGFVAGGTLNQLRNQAALLAAFNKPFWLQLVGAGPTTAAAMHLGSVLSHAQLPYITCSELWEHDLLAQRLEVKDGYIAVPDGPGLGVELDEGMVEKYTVDDDEPTPTQRYRAQKRILRITCPGPGTHKRVREFAKEESYQIEFYSGSIPGFCPDVTLEVEEDDGSAALAKLHARLVEREAGILRPL